MNPVNEMLKETETVQADTPEAADIVRPYSTRAWDELGLMILTPPEIVWGGFTLGASCVFFGQGGLGKSRVALNIARNQVLGLPFAGLPTARRPLRHLMMGSENSIHRLQNDVRRMDAGLSTGDIAKLGAHVRLATLEGPEDTYIALTPANVERWRVTLEDWPPDVLWADPWGDLLDGDANGDEEARQAIGILRRLLRRVNKDAGLGILAHARTGARNIMQAIGYDAANFGKGSKALYSSARCVWNLAPGDETDNPPLVAVHAKSNDAPKEKPFALRLDVESMLYIRVEDFDLESWRADLAGCANGRGTRAKRARLSEDEAFEKLGDKAVSKTEAKQTLQDAGCTRDDADDLMKRLVTVGRWVEYRPPFKTTAIYVGPPAAVEKRKAELMEARQGKIKL